MACRETFSINDLPEEVIERILYCLSPYSTYKSASLVCKLWSRLIKGVSSQKHNHFCKSVANGSIEWHELCHQTGPTITARYSHSAVYHNKYVYIFGGCTASSATFSDLWCLDLASREWIRPLAMGTYPTPKACASLVVYGDYLVLFGGWCHPSPYPLHQAARFFNELHVYHMTSNKWTLVNTRNVTTPVAGHAACLLQHKMIVFGGSHAYGTSCNDLWILDLNEKVWERKELVNPPPPRYGHSQMVLDDHHILVIGGCQGPNSQLNDVWLLTAGTEEDVYSWDQVDVRNPENSVSNLWMHPATKVGNSVVVLSKLYVKDTQPPSPPPVINPQLTSRRRSRVWVPPLEDQEPVPPRPDSVPNRVRSVSPRQGMPSVRPNAMNDPSKRLDLLNKYETKYRQIRQQNNAQKHVQDNTNLMYLHILDISTVMSLGFVSWQPVTVTEQNTVDAAKESIFFSLSPGRGELILFGGIKTDLNSSMQMGVNTNSLNVSNKTYFIRPVTTT